MFKRLFGKRRESEAPQPVEAPPVHSDHAYSEPDPSGEPPWTPSAPGDPGAWVSETERFGIREWVDRAVACGMREEAHAFMRLDLEEARRLAGDRQDLLLDLLKLVSLFSLEQGDTASAERLATEALAIARSSPHATDEDVAGACVRLGAVSRHRGDHEAALAYFTEAVELRQRYHGPDHELTKDSEGSVASVVSSRIERRPDWQVELAQQIEELRQEAFCAAMAGDHANAETILRAVLNEAVSLFGSSHPDVAEIYRRLAEALDARGHHQDARKYQLHHLDIVRHEFRPRQCRRAARTGGDPTQPSPYRGRARPRAFGSSVDRSGPHARAFARLGARCGCGLKSWRRGVSPPIGDALLDCVGHRSGAGRSHSARLS